MHNIQCCLCRGRTTRNVIPLPTTEALCHASYFWHSATPIYQDLTGSPSVTLTLHFFFTTGNIVSFFSFKIMKRCILISESTKFRVPGSWPRESAVANATAYTPQSLLPLCLCTLTNSNEIWGSSLSYIATPVLGVSLSELLSREHFHEYFDSNWKWVEIFWTQVLGALKASFLKWSACSGLECRLPVLSFKYECISALLLGVWYWESLQYICAVLHVVMNLWSIGNKC